MPNEKCPYCDYEGNYLLNHIRFKHPEKKENVKTPKPMSAFD